MYVFIKNIAKNGLYEYKGLDIDQFISGTHKYDFVNNSVAVETTEKIKVAPTDVEIWTKAQYENCEPQLHLPLEQEEIKKLKAETKQLQEDNQTMRDDLVQTQVSLSELLEFMAK